MTEETQVAAAEATEQVSAETVETPEVTEPETPEVAEQPEKPELTPAEREARALKRRVDRLTREKYRTQAELEQLRQRQPEQQEEPNQQLTEAEVNRRAAALAEQKALNDKCNDIAKTGQKKFPDFMEKVEALNGDVALFDARGATPFMEALLDADDPAALIHHLGSNPDIASELADLTPRQQVRRLAQIEHDLEAKATPPKPSNAPKPIQPVKPVAAAVGPDPSKDPEGWISWRNAQVRK